jgi:hypothetical protein
MPYWKPFTALAKQYRVLTPDFHIQDEQMLQLTVQNPFSFFQLPEGCLLIDTAEPILQTCPKLRRACLTLSDSSLQNIGT